MADGFVPVAIQKYDNVFKGVQYHYRLIENAGFLKGFGCNILERKIYHGRLHGHYLAGEWIKPEQNRNEEVICCIGKIFFFLILFQEEKVHETEWWQKVLSRINLQYSGNYLSISDCLLLSG